MSGGQPLRPDNPLVVQWEYASEERLATRNAAYRRLVHGVDAEQVAFDAVAEVRPQTVLEVGSGMGEFAERVADGVGADVTAVDISPRMVALTAERGVRASVSDVQALSFDDGSFDCAVANWVLYHAPDVERAIGELWRVLRPGGRLVAATLGVDHGRELWDLVGGAPTSGLSFSSENGEALLRRRFDRVERRDAEGVFVFPDAGSMREYIAATSDRAHLADNVPADVSFPFSARSAHAVFVAEKAR
ncbi:MAG TPA: class I SAM-dependent methyltransferase [Gaiellaceae bacterium]|nr:class I SAM-dependent methyltransferase [Gaiellaceae bacterium]